MGSTNYAYASCIDCRAASIVKGQLRPGCAAQGPATEKTGKSTQLLKRRDKPLHGLATRHIDNAHGRGIYRRHQRPSFASQASLVLLATLLLELALLLGGGVLILLVLGDEVVHV